MKLYILDPLPNGREQHPIYLSREEYNFITGPFTANPTHEEDILAYRSFEYMITLAKVETPNTIIGRNKDAKKGVPQHFSKYIEEERLGQYLQMLEIKKAQNSKSEAERKEAVENITRSVILLAISEARSAKWKIPGSYNVAEFDDFLNEGILVLSRCIKQYRTSEQRAFSTYYTTSLEYGFYRLYVTYKGAARVPANWEKLKARGMLSPEQYRLFKNLMNPAEIDKPSYDAPDKPGNVERKLASDTDVALEIETADAHATLKDIVDSVLTPKEARMFYLKHIDGYTPTEIAEKFNMNPTYMSKKLRDIDRKASEGVQTTLAIRKKAGTELAF
jgi:RNA polymerase sigma factor (sigma-70 family)